MLNENSRYFTPDEEQRDREAENQREAFRLNDWTELSVMGSAPLDNIADFIEEEGETNQIITIARNATPDATGQQVWFKKLGKAALPEAGLADVTYALYFDGNSWQVEEDLTGELRQQFEQKDSR